MSTPASRMTRTAFGFIPCVSMPAEYASITSPLSRRAHPSAIWLRQELPVHRNSTLIFPLIMESPDRNALYDRLPLFLPLRHGLARTSARRRFRELGLERADALHDRANVVHGHLHRAGDVVRKVELVDQVLDVV